MDRVSIHSVTEAVYSQYGAVSAILQTRTESKLLKVNCLLLELSFSGTSTIQLLIPYLELPKCRGP